MACERHHKALIEVALGARELHPESELSAHLTGCADCRSELEAQRRLAAAIDFGVAASVAADPSPEFAARIRQRIASEHAPAPVWWLGIRTAWMPLIAGALAVLLLAFWFARRQPMSPLSPAPEIVQLQKPSTPVTPKASSKVSSPPQGNSVLAPAHGLRAKGSRRTAQSPRTNGPEVIVFPGEREAVLQFFATIRSGKPGASAALVSASAPLEVKDLKISPLEVPALDSGPKPGEADKGNPSGIERADTPRRL